MQTDHGSPGEITISKDRKIWNAYRLHSACSAVPLSRNHDSVSPHNPCCCEKFLCRNCFLFDQTTLINHIGMQKEACIYSSMRVQFTKLANITARSVLGLLFSVRRSSCCSVSCSVGTSLSLSATFWDIWASGVSCLACLCSAEQMCVRRETA